MAGTITPPGKARIMTCPECAGGHGQHCAACDDHGKIVIRACPRCGDIGWDYVNGTDDRDGMACRINCGHTWTAADPGWCAQVLPGQ